VQYKCGVKISSGVCVPEYAVIFFVCARIKCQAKIVGEKNHLKNVCKQVMKIFRIGEQPKTLACNIKHSGMGAAYRWLAENHRCVNWNMKRAQMMEAGFARIVNYTPTGTPALPAMACR